MGPGRLKLPASPIPIEIVILVWQGHCGARHVPRETALPAAPSTSPERTCHDLRPSHRIR